MLCDAIGIMRLLFTLGSGLLFTIKELHTICIPLSVLRVRLFRVGVLTALLCPNSEALPVLAPQRGTGFLSPFAWYYIPLLPFPVPYTL